MSENIVTPEWIAIQRSWCAIGVATPASMLHALDEVERLTAEIDRLRAREIIMAQHEDTGRTWNGPRCAIPSRYFEVNPAEQEVGCE